MTCESRVIGKVMKGVPNKRVGCLRGMAGVLQRPMRIEIEPCSSWTGLGGRPGPRAGDQRPNAKNQRK